MAEQKSGNRRQKKTESAGAAVSRTLKPDDLSLEDWQRQLRRQFGEKQKFRLKNAGDHPVFSEFSLTNPESGKSYKIAIRGDKAGDNFCSCPDFKINNLGTCKHIEFTLSHLKKKPANRKEFAAGYLPPYSEVYLSYGLKPEIRFKAGAGAPTDVLDLTREYFSPDGILKPTHLLSFPDFLGRLPKDGIHEVRCYDDVLAHIAECQDADHRRRFVETQLRQGIDSPLLANVLKTDLYPYQKEGALFAAKTGRCLIGDDMGLGKTIQALAAVELHARLHGVAKVLIVTPTSLKHQWRAEIEKFTNRTAEVIEGPDHARSPLYARGSFYKIMNYELIHRDLARINAWAPDLIILDEAQRIKNWKTRTARSVKKLQSVFAIVLTGTPIENRIEELHSIVEFIDPRFLGPLYHFLHTHRITDDAGKVTGYRDLQRLRESLKEIMIRRKKDEVLRQLPARTDKNFFVPLTKEQWVIHDENREIVVKLVAKWRRYKFLSDADQLRLRIALNYMRMVADNTYLVDKKTVHGPKLEELEILLKELVVEGGEKVVIFSQWLRMTELVEVVLKRNKIGYTHLNGSVPSKERRNLMDRFREDDACKVFLSTDAGGVGLNLQSGSVVINMDIPWNPAVLEQRIGRIHRMGQKKAVRVVNFVTAGSIEERMLDLLKFKKSLFAGALDQDGENIVMVGESQLGKLMKSVEAMTENTGTPEFAKAEESRTKESRAAGPSPRKTRKESSTAGKGSGTPSGHDALSSLLVSGAKFLSDLGKTVAQSDNRDKNLDALIGRDERTGESYLKLPIPAPAVLQEIVSALSGLLSNLNAK